MYIFAHFMCLSVLGIEQKTLMKLGNRAIFFCIIVISKTQLCYPLVQLLFVATVFIKLLLGKHWKSPFIFSFNTVHGQTRMGQLV